MYTALYDLDGINIDFENVYDDDKDRLTGFVARLAEKLKEQRVVVSIDTTTRCSFNFSASRATNPVSRSLSSSYTFSKSILIPSRSYNAVYMRSCRTALSCAD